jgi:hypothetical protein
MVWWKGCVRTLIFFHAEPDFHHVFDLAGAEPDFPVGTCAAKQYRLSLRENERQSETTASHEARTWRQPAIRPIDRQGDPYGVTNEGNEV